jgi:hypothetical protein
MILSGQFPYYFLFGLIAIIAIFLDFIYKNKYVRSVVYISLIIILSLFAGTRLGWNDQGAYSWIYGTIQPLPNFFSSGGFNFYREEWLFLLTSSFLKCFSDDPLIMFMFFAFVTVVLTLNSYKKYSPFFFTAVLLYCASDYIGWGMCQTRMGLAGAFLLFGMRYLVEKKFLLFLLFFIVAMAFQISSVFILFGLILFLWNPSTKVILIGIFIALLMGMFLPFANKIFSWVSTIGSSSLIDRGLNYYESEKYGYALGVLRPSMIRSYLIICIGLLYRKELSEKVSYFNMFFLFYCGGITWRLVFNDLAIVSARGGELLSIGEPVIIATFLLLIKSRKVRLLSIVVICLLCMLNFYLLSCQNGYPDYVSVLFK